MGRPVRAFCWSLAGAGFGVYRLRKAQAEAAFPNTPVRKGDFLVLVRCRGALKARRSAGIYTPVVPNLRIAWLAPAGENVNAGDPIVRFDSSTAQQQLMQKEAQLKQAQATLDQALAQSKITAQQDQTELADAKFTVERPGCEVEQAEPSAAVSRATRAASIWASPSRSSRSRKPPSRCTRPPTSPASPRSRASAIRPGRRGNHQVPHRPDGAEGAHQRFAHAEDQLLGRPSSAPTASPTRWATTSLRTWLWARSRT